MFSFFNKKQLPKYWMGRDLYICNYPNTTNAEILQKALQEKLGKIKFTLEMHIKTFRNEQTHHYAVLHFISESICLKAKAKLANLRFGNTNITVREFYHRSYHNDMRLRQKRVVTVNLRRADRRRHELHQEEDLFTQALKSVNEQKSEQNPFKIQSYGYENLSRKM